MKYFLVKKNDKFYKIGCSGFTPQGYEESHEIPKELEQEHQDDLEIKEEQIFEQQPVQMKDENGELVFTDETYVDDSGEVIPYKKPVYIKDAFEQVLVETRKSVVLNETKKAARLALEATQKLEQEAKEKKEKEDKDKLKDKYSTDLLTQINSATKIADLKLILIEIVKDLKPVLEK